MVIWLLLQYLIIQIFFIWYNRPKNISTHWLRQKYVSATITYREKRNICYYSYIYNATLIIA
jgi:hypothetical protein